MIYIDPIDMTDAGLLAGTNTAEPGPGEVAWVASGTYAVADRRIRANTHRVYYCVQPHNGRTAPPELDATFWKDVGPTLRWAPFDYYASTVNTSTTGDLNYVISGRYVNAVWLDGLMGASVSISIKNAVGGSVVLTKTQTLKQGSVGYWDYAYGKKYFVKRVLFKDLPIYPAAEITITVTASPDATRSIGTIVRGKKTALMAGGWGGTQWGAKAVPRTFTYRKTNDDGSLQIVLRGSAVDLDCNVMMELAAADQAVDALTRLMSRPVVWFATDLKNFRALNTFGFASKPVISYESGRAEISNYIEGVVST